MTNVERKKGEQFDRGGWMKERTTKNSSIYRHPISFPITWTSETRDLFGLFSYGTFFGTISKEKSSLCTLAYATPAAFSFPSRSPSCSIVFPWTDGFSHTITIDLHRTNIRIFVIPFAGYIESAFLSNQWKRTRSSLSFLSRCLPRRFDIHWIIGARKNQRTKRAQARVNTFFLCLCF